MAEGVANATSLCGLDKSRNHRSFVHSEVIIARNGIYSFSCSFISDFIGFTGYDSPFPIARGDWKRILLEFFFFSSVTNTKCKRSRREFRVPSLLFAVACKRFLSRLIDRNCNWLLTVAEIRVNRWHKRYSWSTTSVHLGSTNAYSMNGLVNFNHTRSIAHFSSISSMYTRLLRYAARTDTLYSSGNVMIIVDSLKSYSLEATLIVISKVITELINMINRAERELSPPRIPFCRL